MGISTTANHNMGFRYELYAIRKSFYTCILATYRIIINYEIHDNWTGLADINNTEMFVFIYAE